MAADEMLDNSLSQEIAEEPIEDKDNWLTPLDDETPMLKIDALSSYKSPGLVLCDINPARTTI